MSGGGITGPVFVYWLARASTASKPINITIIERAPSIVKLGQGIDVEGPAKEIATRMGILDAIKARNTGEQGFRGIDNNNQGYATFEQGGLTQENEIMRGDLCELLTDTVKDLPNVEIQYSSKITDIAQTSEKVRVTILSDNRDSRVEEYDAVIAADGIRSKTRNLMLDHDDVKDCVKKKDLFIAYFSIPPQPQDKPYSRLQHALGGRSVVIRPVADNFSSVFVSAVGAYPALAKAIDHPDTKVRRQAWVEAYSDVNYGEFPPSAERDAGHGQFLLRSDFTSEAPRVAQRAMCARRRCGIRAIANHWTRHPVGDGWCLYSGRRAGSQPKQP